MSIPYIDELDRKIKMGEESQRRMASLLQRNNDANKLLEEAMQATIEQVEALREHKIRAAKAHEENAAAHRKFEIALIALQDAIKQPFFYLFNLLSASGRSKASLTRGW